MKLKHKHQLLNEAIHLRKTGVCKLLTSPPPQRKSDRKKMKGKTE